MIELGRRGHTRSENAHLEFNEAGANIMGVQCLSLPTRCAFVVEVDHRIVGLLIGVEQGFGYLNARYATDVVLYADFPGAGRALLRRFIAWAFDERGVDQVMMGVSFGGKSARSTGAFYRRCGFRHTGGMFVIDGKRGER